MIHAQSRGYEKPHRAHLSIVTNELPRLRPILDPNAKPKEPRYAAVAKLAEELRRSDDGLSYPERIAQARDVLRAQSRLRYVLVHPAPPPVDREQQFEARGFDQLNRRRRDRNLVTKSRVVTRIQLDLKRLLTGEKIARLEEVFSGRVHYPMTDIQPAIPKPKNRTGRKARKTFDRSIKGSGAAVVS